jgi:hypothetical protein
MRNQVILASTLAASVLSPLVASAALYSFSFDNVSGTVAGTVTGEIDLGFITTPTGSGTGAASSIMITSAPAALPSLDQGNVVTGWSFQGPNTFTVSNGVITAYQFGATAISATASDDVMCLNSGSGFSLTGVYICLAGENYLGDGSNYVFNTGGASAVTFEQIAEPAAIPLPASVVLLGSAVLGLWGGKRRSAAQERR